MKLTVFGSTGGTGRELLKQALDQGHDVVACARTPAKLDDLKRERLRVVQGDVLDPSVVGDAVAGRDAVLPIILKHVCGPSNTCIDLPSAYVLRELEW